MAAEELPIGFSRANQLEPGKAAWHPRPPEAYEPKRRRFVDEDVYTLRDALALFRARVACRKINDIMLDGARVGAVFVREPSNEKFLVLFKREPYFHFSRHFPDVPKKGYGMIANLKLVYWCALEGIKIAAILKDKRCYVINAMEFYKFYEQYNTECKHIVDSVEVATPFSMWTRMF